MNQLSGLKQFTTIVADTGDVNQIRKYQPMDATTNPSLILNTINIPEYQDLVSEAIQYGKKKSSIRKQQVIHASDRILVNIGMEILKYIPGYISSEVDARLSFNTDLCILKAQNIVKLYEELGIERSRILIKLAATWQCIQAARELQKYNIKCNLTLLFSFAQSKACAEANVFLVSPFVGRIYDWYHDKNLIHNYDAKNDPGVLSVKKIYKYYKKYNYSTIIMGASFRNIEQILELSGCDRLTISPNLLEQLKNNSSLVSRNLFFSDSILPKPTSLNESEFLWEHNENQMAVEKLSDGIRQFSRDQEKLEIILNSKF
ncbi:transaldolase [Buchnera aphidicola]|uniref:transaldolase n=1 Tax=Buchnera aphidicola TaxID=9 RepID=UPI0034646C11